MDDGRTAWPRGVPRALLIGIPITMGLVVGLLVGFFTDQSEGESITAIVSTRDASVVPNERLDLISDLSTAFTLPPVIDEVAKRHDVSAANLRQRVSVDRVESSSFARITYASPAGDADEARAVITDLMSTAQDFLTPVSPSPALVQAREAEAAADTAYWRVLTASDGVAPADRITKVRARLLEAPPGAARARIGVTLKRLLRQARSFDEIQVQRRRTSAAVDRLLDDATALSTGGAKSLGLTFIDRRSASAASSVTGSVAVRRGVAAGLATALLLAGFSLAAAFGRARRRPTDQAAPTGPPTGHAPPASHDLDAPAAADAPFLADEAFPQRRFRGPSREPDRSEDVSWWTPQPVGLDMPSDPIPTEPTPVVDEPEPEPVVAEELAPAQPEAGTEPVVGVDADPEPVTDSEGPSPIVVDTTVATATEADVEADVEAVPPAPQPGSSMPLSSPVDVHDPVYDGVRLGEEQVAQPEELEAETEPAAEDGAAPAASFGARPTYRAGRRRGWREAWQRGRRFGESAPAPTYPTGSTSSQDEPVADLAEQQVQQQVEAETDPVPAFFNETLDVGLERSARRAGAESDASAEVADDSAASEPDGAADADTDAERPGDDTAGTTEPDEPHDATVRRRPVYEYDIRAGHGVHPHR